MNILRKLIKTKDKKVVIYLVMLLALGVLLMVLSVWPVITRGGEEAGTEPAAVAAGMDTAEENGNGYEREKELEKRLEAAFTMVENVGEVKVMISLTPDKETVYAVDSNTNESYSQETDAQGGSRETRTKSRQDKIITITDKAGTDWPLVLREIEPRIAGVIIIAEGGDSVFVKDALTKAACTILGIEANKVQVFKMKGE